ncbi:MAG: hypothetical protein U0840_27405 [Gemmataceae bacterium]
MYAALLAALTAVPAAAPPVAPPSPAVLARWIEELGDDSFEVRETASRKLREAGEPAEALLLKALDNTDAEIVRRSRSILAEFKWGIYPNTPTAIVELIRGYQAAAPSERREPIRKLMAAGVPGCKALVKIARAEENPTVRKEVFSAVAAELGKAAVPLLEEGNTSALDAMLELGLSADLPASVLHYAAYYALTGQLPAKITEWEARARAAVVPKTENHVLAYLHRARGDLARAAAAAREAEELSLYEAMLYEAGDWKALAGNGELPAGADQNAYLAYRTAYLRLGGSRKGYDGGIDDIFKRGSALAETRGYILPHAKALFLNGRADLALDLIRKSEYSPRMLFELFSVQTRLKEAFAVVDAARTAETHELGTLEILEARTRYQLGEKERAVATLKKFTGMVAKGQDAPWYLPLVEAEIALGRTDEAFAAAARIIAASSDASWPGRCFDKLYDPRGDDATTCYLALRRLQQKETVEQAVARTRRLMDGKPQKGELDELIRLAGGLDNEAARTLDLWRVLGDACAQAKQTTEAETCFRRANTPRAWLRLGDLHAARKDWLRAATDYQTAHRLGLKSERRTQTGEDLPCLALWLAGHALREAGRTAEGKALIDRAHLLPLGDGEMRFEFVRVLRRRGHREAVRREQESLRRFGEPRLAEPASYYTGEGLRASAIEASSRKEWLRAADGYEQTFLRCLQPTMNFARATAYVTVPAHIYAMRARGLVQADRIAEALVEAERARLSQPASVELAMYLVPELEKRDRKKEADAIYRASRDRYVEVLRDYPRCAWAANQLAWLSACCRRDLDEGLKHARKAVELTSDSAAYHDTLAEVLFQLGKKAEAITAQKKAIELQPERDYFKRQLKRLEAGDPRSPRIEEED